jgi:hypothetical protein
MSFSKVGFDKAVMILCQLLFLLAVKKKNNRPEFTFYTN